MFSASDPRAALAPRVSPAIKKVKAFGNSSHVKFAELAPGLVDAAGRHWFARGQHFVLAYSECSAGGLLAREHHPDEYFVISPDPAGALEVVAGGETLSVPGGSVVIVPPGQSVVKAISGGRVIRIFTHLAQDLSSLAANAASYESVHPNIDPFEPWPEPVGGWRLRAYSLDVPEENQKHGRIWRTSGLMFYLSPARIGPRDVTRLSPHSHEGFEQGTFTLEGDVIQHLRWPWTPNKTLWREDEHVACPQHSLSVMPALVEHTTQFMSKGANTELVIFAPPRKDWSLQPGWVLNDAEYPIPQKFLTPAGGVQD